MRLSERLIYADIRLGQVLYEVHDRIVRAEYLSIEQRLSRQNIEPTDELVQDKELQQQSIAILAELIPAVICAGEAFDNLQHIDVDYAIGFGVLAADGISRFIKGHGILKSLYELGCWILDQATYVDRKYPDLRYKFPNLPRFQEPFEHP